MCSARVTQLLTFAQILIIGTGVYAYDFPGGSGTPDDPYHIADANDLIAISATPYLLQSHFALINDISCDPNNPQGESIIEDDRRLVTGGGRGGGGQYLSRVGFSGTIDGDGHVIQNLSIPLLSTIESKGIIENLGLTDVHINPTEYPGSTVGGLAVWNKGTIRNCYVLGELGAVEVAGGLIGSNMDGEVTTCYASVVMRQAETAGGLIGTMQGGSVNRCYSVGYVSEDPNGRFLPLIGAEYINNADVRSSYFRSDATSTESAGNPLTESQMKSQDSFTGWDFYGRHDDGIQDRWFMPEDGYPILIWQTETGLKKIPDLTELSTDQAEALLLEKDLTLGNVQSDYHPDIMAGTITTTIPQRYVPVGTSVDVLSSLGVYDWDDNAGDGSAANPYEISTVGQLLCVGPIAPAWPNWEYYGGEFYQLMNDLDLSSMVFQSSPVGVFSDILDGGGHTIFDLTIAAEGDEIGLFGRIAADALVTDLTLQNAYVQADNGENIGGLVGINEGFIQDCHVSGAVTGCVGVGGLVGKNMGQISMCHSAGSVTGLPGRHRSVIDNWYIPFIPEAIGGLVGLCGEGLVSTSYSTATVDTQGKLMAYAEETARNLGGLIGQLGIKEDVPSSFYTRIVSSGTVANCYATGVVTAHTSPWNDFYHEQTENLGGLIGYLCGGTVSTSYALESELTGDGNAAVSSYYLGMTDPSPGSPWNEPYPEAVALTEGEMKSQQSFFAWDFDNIWTICEGNDYPRLQWENRECPEF